MNDRRPWQVSNSKKWGITKTRKAGTEPFVFSTKRMAGFPNWLSNQQPRKHSERFTSNNTKNNVFKIYHIISIHISYLYQMHCSSIQGLLANNLVVWRHGKGYWRPIDTEAGKRLFWVPRLGSSEPSPAKRSANLAWEDCTLHHFAPFSAMVYSCWEFLISIDHALPILSSLG